jgi:hypothetical protein
MTDTTIADTASMPVFGPDGKMMGNMTSDQGQPPSTPPIGGAGVLQPQSPLSVMGMPPAPTPPPSYPQMNFPPIPQAPQQQKLPAAPDAKDYQKGAMEFASAMAVLGAVAGRFTRAPGGAALNAFAGALKGWQEGNLQAYENAAKQWEQNTKATIENNQQLMEKYKIALQNRQLNIDQQMAEIQLISAQYHDKMMYDAAAAKNYTLVAQIYEKNQQYTEKAKLAADALQLKRDQQREKNEQSAAYWLSPEGQERLPTLSPAQQAGVKQLIDIYAQKGTGKSAIAQNRQQYINEYTAEHGIAPTSAQITEWEAERAGAKAEATAVGRRAGGLAVAVQEAHDTVPNVLAAAQKSAGRGLATWNAAENRWKVEKGDPDFAYYVQQLNSLINVYGRVISGGGKGTVSDLEHARQMLNPNMPLSAVEGSLRGFSREIDIAEKAPEKVRARMRGGAVTPAETPPETKDQADSGWGKATVVGQ